ncbi:MAG TPA: hypothetical protein V6D15_16580 [Oculatellaceae cyanobacterium]|jgi:F0F1-type ATP synthase alpha subunit
MTDRAKEFKSEHLKQISLQLDFTRRRSAFPGDVNYMSSYNYLLGWFERIAAIAQARRLVAIARCNAAIL